LNDQETVMCKNVSVLLLSGGLVAWAVMPRPAQAHQIDPVVGIIAGAAVAYVLLEGAGDRYVQYHHDYHPGHRYGPARKHRVAPPVHVHHYYYAAPRPRGKPSRHVHHHHYQRGYPGGGYGYHQPQYRGR